MIEMIKKSGDKPEKIFEQFVENWFELISEDRWEEAFVLIDLPPSYGEMYTPETFRQEIENDHFCEGTMFRKQHPEIVYSNPKSISGSGSPSVYPLEGTHNYAFEYDVPLNNEFSDLTSGWEFIDAGSFYKVKLDFLHVL
ncbi:hypothetical protein [Alcanivorax sp.]|uniref:hypothetical protein n=1 Tax=Alcanivorax sp. TaxID=1872427 RepID=UPI0025BDCF2E|nr:hypothetical protein [Alcanivorax sp.]